MRSVLALVATIAFCGCTECVTEEQQLKMNKPIKIPESGGITIWKVKDSTPGGKTCIYYSTPSGKILAEDSVE